MVGLANAVGWVGGSLAPLYIGAASGRFGMGNCIAASAVVYFLGALILAGAIRRRARSTPGAPGHTLISPPSSA